MILLAQIAGWLLFVAGIVAVLMARFPAFIPFESDDQATAFEAIRSYVFGAGLVAALISAAILRATGIDIDLFSSV